MTETAPPAKLQKINEDTKININTTTQTMKTFTHGQTFAESTVQEFDLIIIHVFDDELHAIRVTRRERFACRFGNFTHEEFIGKPFGSRIFAKKRTEKKMGFVTILRPTPTLWTLALKHRTQILYHVDISLILLHLNIKPGKRVIEAGTGSGSLSTSLATTLMPNGRLYSFEFHEGRYKEAMKEFKQNGLSDIITLTHRDVIKEGFSMVGDENLDETIDAVFLDLPNPEECVANVKKVLVKNGVFCFFAPCIEQIQRTVVRCREEGFIDIKTFECLSRRYKFWRSNANEAPTHTKFSKIQQKELKSVKETLARPQNDFLVSEEVMRGHTGYLTFCRK